MLQEESLPYEFFVSNVLVTGVLSDALKQIENLQTEKVLHIVYQQQAVFQVPAVTRCSSSMSGLFQALVVRMFVFMHVCVSVSVYVCVCVWCVCTGHTDAVISVLFSPDGRYITLAFCVWYISVLKSF